MLSPSSYQEACDLLMPRGFVLREVAALYRWRDTYRRRGQWWLDLQVDLRRLEFVRWLVATGRLSEYPS